MGHQLTLPFFLNNHVAQAAIFCPDCESNAVINVLETELAKAIIIRARDHNLKLMRWQPSYQVHHLFSLQQSLFHVQPTTQMILQIELALHLDLVLHLLNSINIFATLKIILDGSSPKIKLMFPLPFGWDAHFWGDWVRLSHHLHGLLF